MGVERDYVRLDPFYGSMLPVIRGIAALHARAVSRSPCSASRMQRSRATCTGTGGASALTLHNLAQRDEAEAVVARPFETTASSHSFHAGRCLPFFSIRAMQRLCSNRCVRVGSHRRSSARFVRIASVPRLGCSKPGRRRWTGQTQANRPHGCADNRRARRLIQKFNCSTALPCRNQLACIRAIGSAQDQSTNNNFRGEKNQHETPWASDRTVRRHRRLSFRVCTRADLSQSADPHRGAVSSRRSGRRSGARGRRRNGEEHGAASDRREQARRGRQYRR